MKVDKKYFGHAVDAILKTIIEGFCFATAYNELENVLEMFNTAQRICVMWDLQEMEHIEVCCKKFNGILSSRNNEYRILKDNNVYRIVTFV